MRDWWPTPDEMQELLREHGTVRAVARHFNCAPHTVRRILKRYGMRYEPHQRDMPVCEVRFGWDAEDVAAELLEGSELVRLAEKGYAKYDLLWNGKRINVKAATPTRAGTRGVGMGWSFHVKRGLGHCDYFFCICCDANQQPLRYLLVPASAVPTTILRLPLTFHSKWAAYEWQPD